MTGTKKSLLIFPLLFSFLFSLSCLAEGQEAGFPELLNANVQNFKNLDYFDSKVFSFQLPKNRKFILEWGFVGSGDILAPFPELKISLQGFDDVQSDDNQEDKQFTLQGLTAVVLKGKAKKKIKEELLKYKSDFSAWVWLLDPEVSSDVKLFILKSLLLLQCDFDGQESKRKIEFLRLLFRLSQSKTFKILDKNKPISSYLPDAVKEMFNDTLSPEGIKLVDKLWIGLANGFDDYTFDENGVCEQAGNGISVVGYVFDDADVARKCCEKLSNEYETTSSFKIDVEKNVPGNYEVIDYQDFVKFKGISFWKFVGCKDFGRITKDLADVPEEIKNKVLATSSFPALTMVDVNDEIWILHALNKFSFAESLKLSFIALLKGYKEYKQVKLQLPEQVTDSDNNDQSLKEEEIADQLQALYSRRDQLIDQIKFLGPKIKQLEVEVEQKSGNVISKMDEFFLNMSKKEHEKLQSEKKEAQAAQFAVEKQIRKLKKNPYILLSNVDKGAGDKNILQLIVDIFVGSPELNGMFVALNGDIEEYAQIRQTLLKRISYILNNTQGYEENSEIYEYVISSLFPEFKGVFKKSAKKGKQDTLDKIIDAFIS